MTEKNYRFFLLTGKIRTGKSTSVLAWSKTLENVGGIVQTQENDKRFIVDLKTKERKELTTEDSNDSLAVGKYFFNKSVIEWAKSKLFAALEEKAEWLIFDEYGICEFNGKCFEPEISEALYMIKEKNISVNALIVVRENLLERFLDKFAEDFDFTVIRDPLEIPV